jgi:hypothetical protein
MARSDPYSLNEIPIYELPPPSKTKLSDAKRGELLAKVGTYKVGHSDQRVEHQGDHKAVLVSGSKPNHLLHLILTVLTFGLWAIVWIIVAISGGEKRNTVAVDEYGGVTTSHL